MAQPTPRADALRQMREARFEAEQKRLKDETSKPVNRPEPAQKAAKTPAAKRSRKPG
jgi:hypothetical protein